jgi:hypothetical protein
MRLRPWWLRLTLLLCRIKSPRILWPRLTLLLCRIKSLRILPFVSSLRAVDMRVSSKLLTRLDPQSFGFLLFHVLFVLYFCPAHAREVPHFTCSPEKLCLKKYRSYSPSNGSKPYNIIRGKSRYRISKLMTTHHHISYPSLYQVRYNSMFDFLKLQYINCKLNDLATFTRYSG